MMDIKPYAADLNASPLHPIHLSMVILFISDTSLRISVCKPINTHTYREDYISFDEEHKHRQNNDVIEEEEENDELMDSMDSSMDNNDHTPSSKDESSRSSNNNMP
eukprot:609897_1